MSPGTSTHHTNVRVTTWASAGPTAAPAAATTAVSNGPSTRMAACDSSPGTEGTAPRGGVAGTGSTVVGARGGSLGLVEDGVAASAPAFAGATASAFSGESPVSAEGGEAGRCFHHHTPPVHRPRSNERPITGPRGLFFG